MASQMANTPVPVRVLTTEVDDIPAFIDNNLRPLLPYSLPLLRRCQFHLKQKINTPAAEVWLAKIDQGGDDSHAALPWLAAHIDLTVSGQTQVWLFASWEPSLSSPTGIYPSYQTQPQYKLFEALFSALYRHLNQDLIPLLPTTPPPQWQRLKNEGKIISEPFSPSKVLFGTVAECLWPFLDNTGTANPKAATSREDKGYLKYIMTTTPDHAEPSPSSTTNSIAPVTPNPATLPPTFRTAPIPTTHLQLILDRTPIPRTLETLSQLPNIGIFPDSSTIPVSWGLLGKDASLSSLHTEPEFRGRRFAEVVARELVRKSREFLELPGGTTGDAAEVQKVDCIGDNDKDGVVYSHVDVSESNKASRRVMEKIGGKPMWRVGWIEIDVGMLRQQQGEIETVITPRSSDAGYV